MVNKRKDAKVKAFTLIEILTVLAIIVVLAGLITPAVLTARTKARVLEANTKANEIKIAIEQFKTDNNGLLPVVDTSTPTKDTILYCNDTITNSKGEESYSNDLTGFDLTSLTSITAKRDYADLYRKLLGEEAEGTTLEKPKNKRKKSYLTAKNGIEINDTTTDDQIIESFITKWGSPYVVLLDTNYDNKIELKINGNDVILNGSVFVLAPGPKGTVNARARLFKVNDLKDNYYLDSSTIKSFK